MYVLYCLYYTVLYSNVSIILRVCSSISPIREIQLELILLQFVVPTLLEHGNSRAGLKFLIKHWARLSAYLLWVWYTTGPYEWGTN